MRPFRRRIFLLLGALLAVSAGAVYAWRDRIAETVVRRVVVRLESAAAARGATFTDITFSRATLVGLGEIRCDDVRGELRLQPQVVGWAQGRFALSAEHVVARLSWPWQGRMRLSLLGGSVRSLDAAGASTGDELLRITAHVQAPLSWRAPAEAVRRLENELRLLAREGRTHLPVEFSALARFRVRSHEHELPMRSAPTEDGGMRLTLDRRDVERVASSYVLPLTEMEIELVAEHPVRASTLLRLSERASRASIELRRRERGFPYDAFRHVYWSWLLTREFGPDFSEQVTDAHEIGATYETGAASRRMDLHNNAVGRAYAIAGVPEDELVTRVLRDPNVMRSPPPALP